MGEGVGLGRGFTLIELLVVISIIGLLSSVVLSSLNSARTKADDSQRNSIVGEYVKALTLAYDAAGTGQYPATGNTSWWCLGDYAPTGPGNYGTLTACYFNIYAENTTVNTAVATYLSSLPVLKPVTLFGTVVFSQPIYRCPNAGNCSQAEIQWFLQQSNQQCIKGATPSAISTGTQCNLILN